MHKQFLLSSGLSQLLSGISFFQEERNSIAKSDPVTESVNPEAKSEVSVHS